MGTVQEGVFRTRLSRYCVPEHGILSERIIASNCSSQHWVQSLGSSLLSSHAS
jgi:hypothetical protein